MTSAFRARLAELGTEESGRRWLYVPYDQLTDAVGPLAEAPAEELGIVLVESPWKAAQRPYHKQKLAFVLANLRHFALEQAARGVAVRHVVHDGPYHEALAPLAAELGPLRVMEPAERELREDLAPLVESGALEVLPHAGWLTREEQFQQACGEPPWRMDAFYRRVRKDSGILMEGGKPAGGKFSHDADNRKPWKGEPPAPEPPRFTPDAITREVAGLVETRFGEHPGDIDLAALPATHEDAEALWAWALRECMPHFGPYEDAISTRSSGLFHTRTAPLLNVLRLTPARVLVDVLDADLPLNSREGFVRQVLGWREFVRHVHRETDGFRDIPLREGHPLPDAWWGRPSGMACLDHAVADVWREAWSHHIVRLMVLSNLATLLDLSPRALTDWFWVAYVDAYDWVVEPNVLGMGTFAAGELMSTKPYVSGAAYLDRMGDACAECVFDPKKNCPVTPLYWAFLARHAESLAGNPRMTLPLRNVAKRSAEKRAYDAAIFDAVLEGLARGEVLHPDRLPPN